MTSTDFTATTMSMIGLAASPGTEVLPKCSMASTRPWSTDRIGSRCAANMSGQRVVVDDDHEVTIATIRSTTPRISS